jgi:hypothetical protein
VGFVGLCLAGRRRARPFARGPAVRKEDGPSRNLNFLCSVPEECGDARICLQVGQIVIRG